MIFPVVPHVVNNTVYEVSGKVRANRAIRNANKRLQLAKINSQSQQDFILNLLSAYHFGEVFIGLNDRVQANGLVWQDGSAISYSNVPSGQVARQPGKLCFALKMDGYWFRRDCSCMRNALYQRQGM